jgi:hypothetical protein
MDENSILPEGLTCPQVFNKIYDYIDERNINDNMSDSEVELDDDLELLLAKFKSNPSYESYEKIENLCVLLLNPISYEYIISCCLVTFVDNYLFKITATFIEYGYVDELIDTLYKIDNIDVLINISQHGDYLKFFKDKYYYLSNKTIKALYNGNYINKTDIEDALLNINSADKSVDKLLDICEIDINIIYVCIALAFNKSSSEFVKLMDYAKIYVNDLAVKNKLEIVLTECFKNTGIKTELIEYIDKYIKDNNLTVLYDINNKNEDPLNNFIIKLKKCSELNDYVGICELMESINLYLTSEIINIEIANLINESYIMGHTEIAEYLINKQQIF